MGLPEDDFKRRKNETNETIIYAWTFLKEKYKFPIKLYTETGSHLIDNQYELFKFLRSSESHKTFNLPVVELSALANLLGGTLNVLNTKTNVPDSSEQWGWNSYYPFAPHLTKEIGEFHTKQTLYYITEDFLHFYLICTSSGLKVPPPYPGRGICTGLPRIKSYLKQPKQVQTFMEEEGSG